MSTNPWQQDSDALTTDDVEQAMAQLTPVIQLMRTHVPASLDPETSDVDVNDLPEPLKHYVTCLGQTLTANSELIRCGTAINQHWTPPAGLQP